MILKKKELQQIKNQQGLEKEKQKLLVQQDRIKKLEENTKIM